MFLISLAFSVSQTRLEANIWVLGTTLFLVHDGCRCRCLDADRCYYQRPAAPPHPTLTKPVSPMHLLQLVGRTVDVEATRRLLAEMDTTADHHSSPSARSGGGSGSKITPAKRKRLEKGRGGPRGEGAGGEEGGAGEGGGGAAGGEEEHVVYRWHVDSLMGGMDMDLLPVMEEGLGEGGERSTGQFDEPDAHKFSRAPSRPRLTC